jgi:hypothetical protein
LIILVSKLIHLDRAHFDFSINVLEYNGDEILVINILKTSFKIYFSRP